MLNLGANFFNDSILPYLNTLTSLTTLILSDNSIEGSRTKQGIYITMCTVNFHSIFTILFLLNNLDESDIIVIDKIYIFLNRISKFDKPASVGFKR